VAADSAVVHRDKHNPDGDKWQDALQPSGAWGGTGWSRSSTLGTAVAARLP